MEATLLEFTKQFGLAAGLAAVLLWFVLKDLRDALAKMVALQSEIAVTMALICDRLDIDAQDRRFGGPR
ncbi:MAG: hypothetical protein V1755_02895 [Chloroflexota bacterium]